jgi:hypothetical protein
METNMQTFTLPREAFNLLLEALGGQQKAEVFAKSMESFLVAIDNKATAGIVEKKEMVKIEVREELRKELVTREMFDGQRKEINEKFNVVDEKLKSLEKEIRERFNVVDERFHVVDEKFISLEKVMNARFNVVDEKLKSLNFKLNLFLAVALIALTFANPAFVELIKKYFKYEIWKPTCQPTLCRAKPLIYCSKRWAGNKRRKLLPSRWNHFSLPSTTKPPPKSLKKRQ